MAEQIILEKVIEGKQAVPYTRFVANIPHRKGKIRTGRYPLKASKEILNLVKIQLTRRLLIPHPLRKENLL